MRSFFPFLIYSSNEQWERFLILKQNQCSWIVWMITEKKIKKKTFQSGKKIKTLFLPIKPSFPISSKFTLFANLRIQTTLWSLFYKARIKMGLLFTEWYIFFNLKIGFLLAKLEGSARLVWSLWDRDSFGGFNKGTRSVDEIIILHWNKRRRERERQWERN